MLGVERVPLCQQCDYQIITSLPYTHNIKTKNTSEYKDYCSIPPPQKTDPARKGRQCRLQHNAHGTRNGYVCKATNAGDFTFFLEHTKARFLSCIGAPSNPPEGLVVKDLNNRRDSAEAQ